VHDCGFITPTLVLFLLVEGCIPCRKLHLHVVLLDLALGFLYSCLIANLGLAGSLYNTVVENLTVLYSNGCLIR
jgi:hypothetical protein